MIAASLWLGPAAAGDGAPDRPHVLTAGVVALPLDETSSPSLSWRMQLPGRWNTDLMGFAGGSLGARLAVQYQLLGPWPAGITLGPQVAARGRTWLYPSGVELHLGATLHGAMTVGPRAVLGVEASGTGVLLAAYDEPPLRRRPPPRRYGDAWIHVMAGVALGPAAEDPPFTLAPPRVPLHVLADQFTLRLEQADDDRRQELLRRTARARDAAAVLTIATSASWLAGQVGMIDSDGGVDLSSLSNLMVYNLFVTPVAVAAIGGGAVGWSVAARRHRTVEASIAGTAPPPIMRE